MSDFLLWAALVAYIALCVWVLITQYRHGNDEQTRREARRQQERDIVMLEILMEGKE